MYFKLYLALFIVFLLPAAACRAQDSIFPDISEVYLNRLIASAKANYPRVKFYQYKVEGAKIGIHKAKASWADALSVTAVPSSYLLSHTTTNNGFQFGLFLNFGALFQKAPNVKVARGELKSALAEQDEYTVNITAMVKQRYYAYLQQKAILNLRIKAVSDAENGVKLFKYKFEKGEETYDTYNKSLALYTEAAKYRIDAEADMLTAKSSLEEIIGQKLEDIN